MPFVPLRTEAFEPKENMCHHNATAMEEISGYTAVRGWLCFDFAALMTVVRFTAHSVVSTADGTLIDLTPSRASQRYPFLRVEEDDTYVALIEESQVQYIELSPTSGKAIAFSLPR